MTKLLGKRTGSILTGFLGGLISSTATTASLSKKSRIKNAANDSSEMLIFLSATVAMLTEGAGLVFLGTSLLQQASLSLFLGPLLAAAAMIFFYSRKITTEQSRSDEIPFQILPILKLSFFIVSVLLLSKLLQSLFGHQGLIVLTFLVSLFEIHGSVIANVQLHESGAIDGRFLCNLVAISIFASYLSKLFLVLSLGSSRLKQQVLKSSLFLFVSLLLSWIISFSLI